MKRHFIYTALLALLLMGCQEEFELTDAPPTTGDAAFTVTVSSENDNIYVFEATGPTSIKNWDLGNGAKGTGKIVTGIYPLAGSYTVTLTIFAAGGSISTEQEIVIDETDFSLLDKPIYNKLTGGVDFTEGKIWVVDSARSGHFGVGPNPSSEAGDIPEWYQANANEKAGAGMYDDRYVFNLYGFAFGMNNNSDVYINGAQGPNFPGSFDSGVGDLTAPFEPSEGLIWSVTEPEGSYPILTISGNGFIGYYAGTQTYQIISLDENEMFLRYVDGANSGLAWYLRLIPAGYDPNAG